MEGRILDIKPNRQNMEVKLIHDLNGPFDTYQWGGGGGPEKLLVWRRVRLEYFLLPKTVHSFSLHGSIVKNSSSIVNINN